MKPWLRAIVLALATGAFVSFLVSPEGSRRDAGAGTLGALVGFAFIPLLPKGAALVVFLAIAVLVSLIVIGMAKRVLVIPDDPRIVIDEIVGAWVAIALLPRTVLYLAAAFLLFRLFDIWKPGIIRVSQSLHPESIAILADDVLAGLFSCGLLHALHYLSSL